MSTATERRTEDALARFHEGVAHLAETGAGESEARLRSPIAQLLVETAEILDMGQLLLPDETTVAAGSARADFAAYLNGALVGHIELKAPGKGADPTRYTGHDARQWEVLACLPNLIYTDGEHWTLWQEGSRVAQARSPGVVTDRESSYSEGDWTRSWTRLVELFLNWEPQAPTSPRALAVVCARLCRLLRAEVADSLHRGDARIAAVASDWREMLFPEIADDDFTDAYAQVVTFALLLARVEGIPFEARDGGAEAIEVVAARLRTTHSLMALALQALAASDSEASLGSATATLMRVLGKVEWAALAGGSQHSADSASLYFYEDFLAEYDPVRRRASGSYYTPVGLVDFMVGLTDNVVRDCFGLELGLADDDVTVVDPATGTGTFLLRALDRAARTVGEIEGSGAVRDRLADMASRLVGFEIQAGPYAVAQLRLTQEFRERQVPLSSDETRVYLTDTLADPKAQTRKFATMLQPLARSREQADIVKNDTEVLVCIGNPPYGINARGTGGWVEEGSGSEGPPLLAAWRPAQDAGVGRHTNQLLNLFVYFWRWATWKVFENAGNPRGRHGVVTFVTTSAWLSGDGFVGMREWLRRQASAILVVGLSPEGHRPRASSLIFEGVQHEVCVVCAVREPGCDESHPAPVRYRSVREGSRQQKFEHLSEFLSEDAAGPLWQECPSDWTAPFLPAGTQEWLACPRIEDIFPWSSSGVTGNRTWPTWTDKSALRERWQVLIAESDRGRKAELFKETDDRDINRSIRDGLPGHTYYDRTLSDETGPCPEPVPYGWRSFDRRWIIPDKRVLDRPRPPLWVAFGEHQLHLTVPNDRFPDSGAAISFTELLPDLHHYAGRGGRAIPLWRDSSASIPNVADGFLEVVREHTSLEASPEDVARYVAATCAHEGFTRRYRADAMLSEVRVPFTRDPDLWRRAVSLGEMVIRAHAPRWKPTAAGGIFAESKEAEADSDVDGAPTPGARVDEEIRDPEAWHYDATSETLHIGAGTVRPVKPPVLDYEVGGVAVVPAWLDDRVGVPGGKRGTDLDDIIGEWNATTTSALRLLLRSVAALVQLSARQDSLLSEIAAAPQVTVADLEAAGVLPIAANSSQRKAPKTARPTGGLV
ncbi:MAG: N-6 DNA methylase [Acidimicrobiales bacterium]|nr:N-6 DNA methylase [Acidimicrobiales bacterium]MYA25594.1 N-6 DNA methylase [Acidimicrobiales bacterium]MYA81170.1 N-6 DNA methylase [Acidimicrobiales bacterium]MYB82476.1 N-6 DNA methylase [Acidimicrobiales bacterium]MYD82689.1 N-6 DNA methylase [Acidimicrobiales bacterium]